MPEPTIPLPHRARGRRSPAIVLLHGFGGDILSFANLHGPLSKLRRTIALELPGHGKAVAWPEPADATACARAVVATLDALSVDRATLVGHSLGGAVASIVGLMRPDMVERLVLLAPGGFGPQMNVRLLRRYAHMVEEADIRTVLSEFFGDPRSVPAALPRLVAEQRADPAIQRSFRATVELLARDEGQGVLPLDKLATASFPVSLVWGLADRVLPVSQALEAPPDFARHLVPDVGHMPHLEAPDLVLRILARTVCGHL